jgi:type II pantothenate kinase
VVLVEKHATTCREQPPPTKEERSLRRFPRQIGGSLAKLVYFSREPGDDAIGGRLNFLKFETDRIDACIEFMRKLQADHKHDNGTTPEDLCVMATGGGAFKYYDQITKALGVKVLREDEMECLIIGMNIPSSG